MDAHPPTEPGPAHPPTEPGPLVIPHVSSLGDSAGIRLLLPVGRSGWAIAAGYAGLFSVVPVFAPIALILGIVAVVDIRRHPQSHGMGRAIFGIVMGAICSVVLGFMIISALD